MKVTRRWILGFGLGSLGVAALGSLALPFRATSQRFIIQQVIYYYVPGIIFDGDDLAEFAKYIHRKVLWPRIIGRKAPELYGATFFLYHTTLLKRLLPEASSITHIDQTIMDVFFLCTDFW